MIPRPSRISVPAAWPGKAGGGIVRNSSGPMNSMRPVRTIAAGRAVSSQPARLTRIHRRSRQVARSVSSQPSRRANVSGSSSWTGGGRYGSGIGSPHHWPASRRVWRARLRTAVSVPGAANQPRPSPAPVSSKPSSACWVPLAPLPTTRMPQPSAVRPTAASKTASRPSSASISPANASPRAAATRPATRPSLGLPRWTGIAVAIASPPCRPGRVVRPVVPCQSAGRAGRAEGRLSTGSGVYLGLPGPGHAAVARTRSSPQPGCCAPTAPRAARPGGCGGGEGRVGLMALTSRKVLLLAADDFEDMELLYPLHRLIEEDVAVTVAGLDDHPVKGKKGYGPLPVDTTVAQVSPGGYAPDKLRRSDIVLDLVRAFDDAKKPIAFICHAGWVPISAKIIKGRRATSVGAIRDDMVNAGADWVDQATVVDGHLISARTPADLGPWMKALLAALEDKSPCVRGTWVRASVSAVTAASTATRAVSACVWARSTSPSAMQSKATCTSCSAACSSRAASCNAGVLPSVSGSSIFAHPSRYDHLLADRKSTRL